MPAPVIRPPRPRGMRRAAYAWVSAVLLSAHCPRLTTRRERAARSSPGDESTSPPPGAAEGDREHSPSRDPRAVRTLTDELNAEGYIHRRDLVDHGWSAQAIRAAVAEEDLIVRRRQWILAPAADAALHAAATHGGLVTCVSEATRRGLWVTHRPDRPHLALSPHSSSHGAGCRWHRSASIAPRGRTLVDSLEDTLSNVARCLPHDAARATWESAIRLGLCSRAHLARVAWRTDAARRLARECSDLSDSGLETIGITRLARAGIPVAQQVRLLGRPVDGLVGRRLVLQFDGWEFHRDAAQRRADLAHDRALHLAGYTVLRFAYADVLGSWPRIEAAVREAIAQGRHR